MTSCRAGFNSGNVSVSRAKGCPSSEVALPSNGGSRMSMWWSPQGRGWMGPSMLLRCTYRLIILWACRRVLVNGDYKTYHVVSKLYKHYIMASHSFSRG